MNKLQEFKYQALIFLSVVFITIGMSLKYLCTFNTIIYSTLVIVISLVLIKYTSTLITNLLFKWKWFRFLITGNKSIEGYWFVINLNRNKQNILSSDSITQISYNSQKQMLETNTYRIAETGEDIFSKSSSVQFNEYDGMYISKFHIGDKENLKHGIAWGNFINKPGSKVYDTWDGISVNLNDNIVYRQQAFKIIDSEVASYKKEHKNEWRKICLQKMKKQ